MQGNFVLIECGGHDDVAPLSYAVEQSTNLCKRYEWCLAVVCCGELCHASKFIQYDSFSLVVIG